jgi:RHS repeat-associated protein
MMMDVGMTGCRTGATTETGLDYFGARYFSGAQGRFTSADQPFADQNPANPQSWNLYSYVRNNPLAFVDPTGRSTHTDSNGNVVAVYDDDDLGVYAHDDLRQWNKKDTLANSGKGINRMGETGYWDEFRAHDDETGAVLDRVARGARIDFGRSFDTLISDLNAEARGMIPGNIALESVPGGKFDIKSSAGIGPNTGRLLNGEYVTTRSAGNYLAGLNATSVGVLPDEIRATSGALHHGGKLGVALHIIFGTSYGLEIPYAERQIDAGIRAGRTIYFTDLLRRMQ